MIKVNCLNPISKVGMNLLPDTFGTTDNLNEADAVLVRSAAMHELELPKSLLAVARAGAGVNNIPLDKCADEGIVVFNTPGANANGVKEIVLAGMLLAARDIRGGMDWVSENRGDENISKTMEKAKAKFAGTEIRGKKLGVIGLGAIGVLIANAATHLGMEVIGCDPFLSVANALNLSRNVKIVKSNSEIFAECDYITVHVPLLDDTKGMFNKASLSMMKDGVVIVNVSRGSNVDEGALLDALNSGKVRAVGLDVWMSEKDPNWALAQHPAVSCTPHIGAGTKEAQKRIGAELVDIVEHFEA